MDYDMTLLGLYWEALSSPNPARQLTAAAALGGVAGAIVYFLRKVA